MHECPLFHWILILSQPLDFKSWLGHSDIWNWTIPSSVRVIRSNDNGIQEQGWVWQYFMRRPACSGQVYRCPRGSLGVPIWAASDYLEEFVILPIQAIQAIHLCWVWDRDQRVGSKGPPRVLSKSQVRRGVSNGSTDRLGAPGNSGIKVCLKNEIFLSKPVLQSGGG